MSAISAWWLLAGAIVAEVLGTSFLKASQGLTRLGPSLVVVLSYVAAFWLLAQALKTIPVGVAYAIWAGAGIALITLVGWWLFGQRLDALSLVGIGLILAGVLVLRLGSPSV